MVFKNLKKRLSVLSLMCSLTSGALCNEVYCPYSETQLSYKKVANCEEESKTKKVLDNISFISCLISAFGASATAVTLNSDSGKPISNYTTLGDAIKYSEPFCASYEFFKDPSVEKLTSNMFEFIKVFDENGNDVVIIIPHSTGYLVNLYAGLGTIGSALVSAVSKLASCVVS